MFSALPRIIIQPGLGNVSRFGCRVDRFAVEHADIRCPKITNPKAIFPIRQTFKNGSCYEYVTSYHSKASICRMLEVATRTGLYVIIYMVKASS